jgi:hypothetical protein
MRDLLWLSRVCLAIAVAWIFSAWNAVWTEYRKEVGRIRFGMGPNAEVPIFNPLDLFNSAMMKTGGNAMSGYVFAGLSGLLAFLCWLLQWHPTRAK